MNKCMRFILVILTVFLFSACGTKPVAEETGGSDSIGTLSLEKPESTLRSQGFSISVNQTGTPATGSSEVKIAPNPVSDPELDYISEIYVIENFPLTFQGTMEIRVPLPKEVLANLANSPDDYYIEALIGSIDTTTGQAIGSTAIPIPVTVEPGKKEAVVNIDATTLETGLGFIRSISHQEDGEYKLDGFTIQVRASYGHVVYAESEHFILKYSDYKDSSLGVVILAEFEKIYNAVKGLGLDLGDYANGSKLRIYLEYMKDADGEFGCTFMNCPYISISSSDFPSKDVVTDISQEKVAAFAHEFFHLIQYIDHKWSGPEFNWLDEATASWFESYYMKERFGIEGYFSEISDANSDFFTRSQFSPPSDYARATGYGAASLISFLTNNKGYGPGFVTRCFVKGESDQAVFLDSLDAAGASVAIDWREYLETMLTNPGSLRPNPSKLDTVLSQPFATIFTTNQADQLEVKIEGSREANLTTTTGLFLPDGTAQPPLSFSMNWSLGEVQAQSLLVNFSDKAPFNNIGILSLDVSTDEWSGVMVLGIPPGQESLTSGTILAGASNFLTSSNLGGASNMKISGFGDTDKAKFNKILLLAFNANGTSAGTDMATISISATFEPLTAQELHSNSMDVENLIDPRVCDGMPEGESCCTAPPNPCPTEGGGGGGGEGGGDSNCPPCNKIPDWCYSCKPGNGITQFLYPFDSTMELTINLDGEGNLTSIDDLYGPIHFFARDLEPVIENDGKGNFKATFRGLTNRTSDEAAYLVFEGMVTPEGAKGNWVMGYDGVGPISRADWTAIP